jgi:hypothetical protein
LAVGASVHEDGKKEAALESFPNSVIEVSVKAGIIVSDCDCCAVPSGLSALAICSVNAQLYDSCFSDSTEITASERAG